MFTGIIEEIGIIGKIISVQGGKKFFLSAEKILSDLHVDDSVAVNGVCLTAVEIDANGFWADAVGETLTKSTLGSIAVGAKVNLERALKLSDRLGGHIVQGHVNGIGRLIRITNRGDAYLLEFSVPDSLLRYIIAEGSIAVNGVSLTVAQLNGNILGVSVIPHTWENTNFNTFSIGEQVNLEVDVIAKYVERMMKFNVNDNRLTIEKLKEEGF